MLPGGAELSASTSNTLAHSLLVLGPSVRLNTHGVKELSESVSCSEYVMCLHITFGCWKWQANGTGNDCAPPPRMSEAGLSMGTLPRLSREVPAVCCLLACIREVT